MIEGVVITPLRQISDERGKVMHMLRRDDPEFEQFGEIYFSMVNPQAIKAWHLHSATTLNYAVVVGMIKLVLYDQRPNSSTRGEVQVILAGEQNYVRVKIPHGIYTGFQGMGSGPAIVANCATLPHDPAESSRLDPFSKEVPYDWNR